MVLSRRLSHPALPGRAGFLVLIFAVGATPVILAQTGPPANDFIVIAHRGVVEEGITENSVAALEEAIRRGYTHVEVDLRPTRDGQAVCLHDRSLRRIADVDRYIDEMSMEELRAVVDEQLVPSFEEFCRRSAGRIGLMPDLKECPVELADAFIESVVSSMSRHQLMDSAFSIGHGDLKRRIFGKIRISWNGSPEELVAKEGSSMKLGERYFAFGHAAGFDEENIRAFQKLGVPVIVSINTFHYLRGDPIEDGLRDIREMQKLGVDGLQIDSVYDPETFGHAQKEP